MAFVETNPDYHSMLAANGLVTARDFLALPGIVCCGHPDRHVMKITVGQGEGAMECFLKREHRVRWRDRLASAWVGCGLSSRSLREFMTLRDLHKAGIGAPEPIAAGEEDDGRAFLLVRELEGYQDVRQFLRDLATAPPAKRHDVARQLGGALARIHLAGFDHPDLYSKHVFVSPGPGPRLLTFRFLDWQRSTRSARVSWRKRCRDLAALDATLAAELATPRERLMALRAYLRAASGECQPADSPHRQNAESGGLHPPLAAHGRITLSTAARAIRRKAERLLERRRIREMRQPPLATGVQNLIWLDGEAMLVTREFREEMGSQIPAWLQTARTPPTKTIQRQTLALPGSRPAELVSRWASKPWRWLLSRLRGRTLVAPELESMNILFRLERYGVVVPRLLAAGQKHIRPWQTESFLLTEPLQHGVPLPRFLGDALPLARRLALRQAGRLLRRMHQANCYIDLDSEIRHLLTVRHQPPGPVVVALATVHGIEKSHRPSATRAQRDLARFSEHLLPVCSPTDLLRGLLAYLGSERLTPSARTFLAKLRRQRDRSRLEAAL